MARVSLVILFIIFCSGSSLTLAQSVDEIWIIIVTGGDDGGGAGAADCGGCLQGCAIGTAAAVTVLPTMVLPVQFAWTSLGETSHCVTGGKLSLGLGDFDFGPSYGRAMVHPMGQFGDSYKGTGTAESRCFGVRMMTSDPWTTEWLTALTFAMDYTTDRYRLQDWVLSRYGDEISETRMSSCSYLTLGMDYGVPIHVSNRSSLSLLYGEGAGLASSSGGWSGYGSVVWADDIWHVGADLDVTSHQRLGVECRLWGRLRLEYAYALVTVRERSLWSPLLVEKLRGGIAHTLPYVLANAYVTDDTRSQLPYRLGLLAYKALVSFGWPFYTSTASRYGRQVFSASWRF